MVFKNDIKRRITTQPLADAIVKLRGTFLPLESLEHFYVAEAPLRKGLNPLLLVVEAPDGSREFRSVLAVLPTWEIHTEPCNSALYRAALGCVRSKYKTFITALRPSNLGRTLPAEVIDGRLCGNSVPLWFARPLSALLDEVAQYDPTSELASEVRALLELKPAKDPAVVPWKVLRLQTDKLDSATDPDWFIFEKWTRWEAEGFGLSECFAEFKVKHKKPGNLKAFTSHLRYLGLPTPRKPGTKPRREKNWRMKKAMREKADSA